MTAPSEPAADLAPAAPTDLDLLMLRVQTGDQAAFSLLYDEVASRVLGVIRRVLLDHAQSEEVAQEVFLEVWQSARSFDPNKGRAMTWIMTMAHRRAVDRVRSSQSSRDRDVRVGVRDVAVEYDVVAETVEVRVEHQRVDAALATLSAPQRQAVELAYYGGLSQSEIAARLDVPLGTVKTRIRDGMSRLRERLGVA